MAAWPPEGKGGGGGHLPQMPHPGSSIDLLQYSSQEMQIYSNKTVSSQA